MTEGRRSWLATFADPATLDDLFAAARDCMRRICDHEPEDCDCELNRFTPVEFAEFVWLAVHNEREGTYRYESGQPNRKRDGQMRLSLAVSG